MSTETLPTEQIVEQIDVTGHDAAARLILSAMSTYVKDADFTAKFGKHGKVCTVQMTVNGHPVPIVRALAETWKRCNDVLESRAREMAVAMVTEAGLEPLAEALRDAEWKIRERLKIYD